MVSGYELHHGDCLAIMPTLAAGSAQTCVTSPPYFGLRDYGVPPTDWPAVEYAPMAGLPALVIPPMTCCLGLEPTVEAYIGHLVLIFRAVRDALRDDGTAWVNLGDSYATSPPGNKPNTTALSSGLPNSVENQEMRRAAQSQINKTRLGLKPKDLIGVPWRFAFAMQADGWWLRQDLIWAKPNPMPESVTDRCTKAHEYIFLFAKSARYWYDHEAVKEEAVYEGRATTFSTPYKHAGRGSGVGPSGNERPGAPPVYVSGGRNKRSVWTVLEPIYKLRDDLDPETRRRVLGQLQERGLL